MARPLVSAIVPTFNRLEWLPEAVRSVQEQTLTDWELLIVDDGSTDGTQDWARTLGDSRVRYVRRPHSGSIAKVRNVGVGDARGSWIAFLDSDDRWRPDKLTRQIQRLHEIPDARWCYTKYHMMDRAGSPRPQPHGAAWQPFEGWFVSRLLTTEAAVLIPTLLVRAELAQRLAFDERLPLAEDYDFALRLAAIAPGCCVDDDLVDVRMHERRTTSLSGPYDGHLGKVMAYRKAARAMREPEHRRVARRQLRSHLAVFLKTAIRHGAVRQMIRVAVALGRF